MSNEGLAIFKQKTVTADNVIIAIGISSFTQIPECALNRPPSCASHTQYPTDFTQLRGHRVVVVGSGQSGLEHAAPLHESGADVELISRGPINWVDRKLYYRTGPARHIFYPPSDVGPPGVNWLCAFPLFFSRLPERIRTKAATRALRPAGVQWLRPRVEERVQLTAHTQITGATTHHAGVRLELSDGSARVVDHLFLGTGYRPHLEKLTFIDPLLRTMIVTHDGYPIQTNWFETSVCGLYVVGALAGYTFGPICRFVTGAGVAGRQIRRHLVDSR